MSKARWFFCFAGICIVAFAAGIVAGFMKNEVEDFACEESDDTIHEAHMVIMEEETLAYVQKEFLHYLVMSDGNHIILSEVFDDDSKKVIEITQFSRSVLPVSDIELLEEGITFEDKDEALMMMENFVS